MLNTFNDAARNVMALAEEQARRLNHEYVGTEHVLLALLDEQANAAPIAALRALGVQHDTVLVEIENLVLRGPQPVASAKSLPLTPRARSAVHFARQEATALGQKQV